MHYLACGCCGGRHPLCCPVAQPMPPLLSFRTGRPAAGQPRAVPGQVGVQEAGVLGTCSHAPPPLPAAAASCRCLPSLPTWPPPYPITPHLPSKQPELLNARRCPPPCLPAPLPSTIARPHPSSSLSYKWRHWVCLSETVLKNMRGKIERISIGAALTGRDKLKPAVGARVIRRVGR